MSTFLMTVAMVSVNALVVNPPSRMELSRCTKWYGANVGCCVGFKDGRGVGEMLGADVGHEVGMRVGCNEGTLLGDIVGDGRVNKGDGARARRVQTCAASQSVRGAATI